MEAFVDDAFLLKGYIAVLVSCGTSDDNRIRIDIAITQEFFSIDLHQIDQVFGGDVVHLATLYTRVSKSTKSYFGDKAGTTTCTLPPKVDQDSLGKAIALDLIL